MHNFIVAGRAYIDAFMVSFDRILPPNYNYRPTRSNANGTTLEAEVKNCFTNAIAAFNAIEDDLNLLVQETLRVDAEINQARKQTENEISKLSRL